MEALFKVRPDEVKEELLLKIRSLIHNEDETEILIQVRNKSGSSVVNEDPAAYWKKLEASEEDKNAGRTITFTMQEFEQYVKDNFS